jgi:hypothetical protein
MEQDFLKSAWQGMAAVPKSKDAIKSMMLERTHPVLKRIRRQLIIEAAAFTVFLFLYYDFFDGNRKPVYANVLLVMGLLFVIIHNIIGYMLTRRPVTGNTIKQTLACNLTKMKTFAITSIIVRMLAAGCLLLFFIQAIRFTESKYWILIVIILVFIIQIVLLSRVWAKRINQLRGTINDF